MRMWPKAAVLIAITLYFGLVHASAHAGDLLTGPQRGPGRPSAGQRLETNLRDFYAGTIKFEHLEPANYAGPSFVPLILNAVLEHAGTAKAATQRRNRHLISWAQQLVMSGGELDLFTRRRIADQTARLFKTYGTSGPARENLMMMLDRLQLWQSVHLPFLTRRAGSDVDSEADEFGTRAQLVLNDADDRSIAEMVEIIRRQRAPRRPAQWALLAQSGLINENELAVLISFLAHEFALAGAYVDLMGTLHPDEPLRAVIERFTKALEDQDETTHSAFLMAQDQSESVGDEDSPRVHRRRFFRHLVENTLFADEPEEAEDVTPTEIANQNDAPSAPARPAVEVHGNVIHTQFGSTCENDFRAK